MVEMASVEALWIQNNSNCFPFSFIFSF